MNALFLIGGANTMGTSPQGHFCASWIVSWERGACWRGAERRAMYFFLNSVEAHGYSVL